MKQIQLIIACLFLAGSLLAIDHSNYNEVEKNELMKVFGDEKVVEQFLDRTFFQQEIKWMLI